jgi:hypothetical protein
MEAPWSPESVGFTDEEHPASANPANKPAVTVIKRAGIIRPVNVF